MNIKNYANQTPLDLARVAGTPPAPPSVGGESSPPPIVSGGQGSGSAPNEIEKLLRQHGAKN